ncbi:MAG: T9SS type A sorting domain-containing protein [Bacteroidota bacterium]
MKKEIIYFVTSTLFFFAIHLLQAQPTIQWQKCLGGSSVEIARCIQQTNDGGYIVAGYSSSSNGDLTGNHGGYDVWVVKLNAMGSIQWQKNYGGSEHDYAFSIQQTIDGGYIVGGTTESNDGDVVGNHGSFTVPDFWILRLDQSGNLLWQKCLGGSGAETCNSIRQTNDGGYILAGETDGSTDGDVTVNHGDIDYWIVKLGASGNIQWQKSLGGSGRETPYSIIQTNDGGYIVAGESNNCNGNHGDFDAWIVKLDTSGNIQWEKSLGGSSIDASYSIRQTSGGGYIVAGNTLSNNGDVSGNHSIAGPYGDGWVVKLNASGTIQWQKCLGGSFDDWANSIWQTNEGGYIVACITKSQDQDVSGNHDTTSNYWDYWAVKLNNTGNIQWQKCLGGSDADEVYSVQQTSDEGFIFAGSTYSINGDVTGNHGGEDFWIVKLNPFNAINETNQLITFTVSPNPATDNLHIQLPQDYSTAEIKIYNLLGQIQQTMQVSSAESAINIAALARGAYMIELRNDKNISRAKFIKE